MVGATLAAPERAAVVEVDLPAPLPEPRRHLKLVPNPKQCGRDELPQPVTALLREVDADVAAGRLEGALDRTLGALAEFPGVFPLGLRHAELLVATERYAPALDLVASLETLLGPDGDDFALDLERLRIHTHPTPEGLLHLAAAALDAGRTDLANSYVPAAIEIAYPAAGSPQALKLAESWVSQQPDNWAAKVLLALELVAAERLDAVPPLLTPPPADADTRSLVAALAVAAVVDSPTQWTLAARLWERVPGNRQEMKAIRGNFDLAARKTGYQVVLWIHMGLIELAAGNLKTAREQLLSHRPPDALRAYAALLGALAAALQGHDDAAASAALKHAASLHARPEVAEFAARVRCVPGGRGLIELGNELAERLIAHGDTAAALGVLEHLTNAAPRDAALTKRYAEQLESAGQQEQALARLTQLLQRQEQTRDGQGAQQTLRAMLQLDPANQQLRERLIDNFLRRGNIEGAVDERCKIADRLAESGRTDEALNQLLQALEVASLTTNWRSLETIFTLIVKIAPNDVDLRHRAITAAIEHGKIGEAVRHLWDVVRICSDSLDLDETIAALHQIIALAPGDSDAYHRLGEALAAIGEFQQAERVYRRLQVLLPDDAAVRAKQIALAALARENE